MKVEITEEGDGHVLWMRGNRLLKAKSQITLLFVDIMGKYNSA